MPRAALLFLYLALALSLLVAACADWGVDGMNRLEAQYPSGGGTDTLDSASEDVAGVDIGEVTGEGTGGTWLMRMQLTAGMKVFADPSDMVLTNLFLVTIPEDGVVAALTFCDQLTEVNLPEGMGETEQPAATRAAIGAIPIEVDLDAEGVPEAQEIAWTWGIKDMEDPFEDKIPEGPDDPQVWDQDDDGHPGVTVHVFSPEGDRYMVRRAIWSFDAGAMSEDESWLYGAMTFTIDEGAVGASSAILETVSEIVPSAENNIWHMRKVAGIGEDLEWDCARLIDEYEGVFKDAP